MSEAELSDTEPSEPASPAWPRVAFIGAGNMAQSLARGMIAAGAAAQQIAAADPIAAAREQLSALGVAVHEDNSQAIAGADVVVLAVKPQVAAEVVSGITGWQANQLVVSIAETYREAAR